MQIPKPFTRARFLIAEPIEIESNAGDSTVEEKRIALQNALAALVEKGEAWRATI